MIEDYDEAENLVLAAIDGVDLGYAPAGYVLESIADSLIGLPRSATFNEFAIRQSSHPYIEDPEAVFTYPLEPNETAIMNLALRNYHSISDKIARKDNWLNPNVESEDGKEWQSGYRNAVADFLLREAEQAELSLSYYGWRTYSLTASTPVAVFHTHEHAYGEFAGTFTEPESRVAITAEVLYADGNTGYVRWDGQFSKIIKEITA